MYNDVLNELGTNFIEYAVAVNTDRAIPNATDGLKPVAKRILYGAFDCGFKNEKPHVKCANIVGNVMADWHPHGDSSIYGTLVRLSQPWIMRYPLIDFHGSNGNIDGDGPAAYRYTEARLAKLTEDGMLKGIKKENVDFVSNYSETKEEPVELPSIFPNLLCNPNSGIGVAMACSWAPHNLKEVATAINDYIDGNEPMLPGPDFPTGGIIINKNDIPAIMKTGHGSVKVRGRHEVDGQKIIFTEIPYGVGTEALMAEIGKACDNEEITGIKDIRNESNKKGFRLVIECEKGVSPKTIVGKLFAKTSLQTSFSYNQVALVDKTPTELNLKDCIKIYVDYNSKCIVRECLFDIKKIFERLHIIVGLIKALDIIDELIEMIKKSDNATTAKNTLIKNYGFSEAQAAAILDMKLSKLAKLEKEELEVEKTELENKLIELKEIAENPVPELQKRLSFIVDKYGDNRKTELTNIEIKKEDKIIENVAPEECVVVISKNNLVKRVPSKSYKTQKRAGAGIKTSDQIIKNIIRTNTVDMLMVFTSFGKMYKVLVNDIPVGTNASKGVSISGLIEFEKDEEPMAYASLHFGSSAKYVLFTTKNGTVKKTALKEYLGTRKNSGIAAIKLRENDSVKNVTFIEDESLLIASENGKIIKIESKDIPISSRVAIGVKGINLDKDDTILSCLPIKHNTDDLAVFTKNGCGKRISLKEFNSQGRGGKGVIYSKIPVAGVCLIEDKDDILINGNSSTIRINATELPIIGKNGQGNIINKENHITSISKI